MRALSFPIINPFRSKVPAGFYDPIKGHTGIDLGTPEGTPITLAVGVTVRTVLEQPQMGTTLYVEDNAGNILVFAHLSRVDVTVGTRALPNQVLALTGNTGSATTGPHLHFEIIAPEPEPGLEMMSRTLGGFSGYNIDPVPYLDDIPVEETPAHWADEALGWMLEHEIITQSKDPNATVTLGEFAVTSKRLAEKVLDWARQD